MKPREGLAQILSDDGKLGMGKPALGLEPFAMLWRPMNTWVCWRVEKVFTPSRGSIYALFTWDGLPKVRNSPHPN